MVPDIAIIGAGPCGLTFARLLELNNINYIIFERDASSTPTPQHQGGTLDLHPKTGQLALKRAGLFEEYSKIARWNAGTGVVMDPAGKTYVNFDKGAEGPEIDRVQLRRLLLDSVPEEKIRWDHAVKAVEKVESGAGWVIRFADGSTAAGFKLIVGADGAWSKIRPLVSGFSKLWRDSSRIKPAKDIFQSEFGPKSLTHIICSSLDHACKTGIFQENVYRRPHPARQSTLRRCQRSYGRWNNDGDGGW